MKVPNYANLVTFLYILLRDELPAGKMEAIMRDHVEKGEGKARSYSNHGLAMYAAELTTRLLRSSERRPRVGKTRL